jgi:hypothetical protein
LDGTPALAWWVVADDRWHDPLDDPTVRQQRLGGTPAVETALRVPGGDVVHRAYMAYAQRDAVAVVEMANESRLPVAIVLSHGGVTGVRTVAAPNDAPVVLPASAVSFPLAHGATVQFVVGTADPTGVAPVDAVVRGWQGQADRFGRFVLPDEALTERVVAARCDTLLVTHGGRAPESLLEAGAAARAGQPVDVSDVAARLEALGRHVRRAPLSLEAALGVLEGTVALAAAGEYRAAHDAARLQRDIHIDVPPLDTLASLHGALLLAAFHAGLAMPASGDGVDLLRGWPETWAGQGVEAYDLRAGAEGTVGFALRWHGARPALLWESTVPVTCSRLDGSFSGTPPKGEALLAG